MHSPLGIQTKSRNGERLVCKLNRSLYSIKQAPRSWHTLLSSCHISYGFCQSKTDPSLYTLIHDGHLFTLAVFVGDCLLIGNKCKFLKVFQHDFSSRFKVEDIGPAIWILGCSIHRNRSRGTLHLVQTQYIKDALQEFGMSDCTPMSTPI